MSDTQMNYMAKFSLDTSDLSKGITGAAISFDAIMIAAKETFAMIKEGYEQTIGKAVEFGEAIHTLADITGESEENVQRLRAAGIATGTSFESISSTIRIFSQRIGDAGESGETLRSKLAAIGVQVKDNNGNYRAAADLYMEINTKLGDMTNVYERNNLAMDIYGRSWYNVADMITKADKATVAYKKLEPISDADIAKAKDFGVQLGIIGDKINMIGVNVGMYALGDGKTGVSIQNMVSGGNARSFWQGVYDWATGTKTGESGADRDPNQQLKAQTEAIAPLIDKYSELTGLELEYAAASAEVVSAQDALNVAMGSGSQSAVDKAALALASAKDAFQGIRKEMYDTAVAANVVNAAIKNIFYDSGAIENQAPSATALGNIGSMNGSMNADLSASLSSTGDIWNYANANQDSSSQSSNFLSQIRAIAAQAQSITLPGGANWTNTASSSGIISDTQNLWKQYQEQKAGSAGITQINYIQGANAQDVANQIAEATSRALARQVTS